MNHTSTLGPVQTRNEGQVGHSINEIAAISHRAEVHMAYSPPLSRDEEPSGTELDPEIMEYGELGRRLSDANQHHAMMYILLDHGMETEGVANQVHRGWNIRSKPCFQRRKSPMRLRTIYEGYAIGRAYPWRI